MFRLLLIIVFICMPLLAQEKVPTRSKVKPIKVKPAYSLKAETLNEGGMSFSMLGESFITLGNYDTNGSLSSLDSGAGYSSSQGEAIVKYGWTSNLELVVGLRYRHNISVTDSTSTTNSNLESAFGGFRYAMPDVDGYKYSFEAKYRQGMFNNSGLNNVETSTEIALGDEGAEFGIGAWLSKSFSTYHAISAHLEYVIPPSELSHEVRFMFENSFHGNTLGAVVGVEGIYAVGNDPYTNDVENRPTVYAGETNLFNSLNRQVVSPFGYLILKLTQNTAVHVGGSKTVLGRSTDDGIKVFGGLTIGMSDGQTQENLKINKFKEYNSEASIVTISEQKQFIKIDQGLTGDFYKGMMVDIFESDFFGGNVLVASGHVYQAGATWAIVRITKRYSEKDLVIGMTVRGY